MNNHFRSQSQHQQQLNKCNNIFNTKNTVNTTKKTPAVVMYVHNDANFPEIISAKSSIVTDDIKPNNTTMYSNIVSTVINNHADVNNSQVPAGWTQITVNKKTAAMEIINANFEKQKQSQPQPENITTKIIKELDYRWYRYKVEYDLIHGENSFHEAHYIVPIYPHLDAELDTDSELSDTSNEYDTDL